jgi:hypothetical protein
MKECEPAVYIEPHWTLGRANSYSGRMPVGEFWQRAEKLRLATVDSLVLSPEDCLIHLALHLFQHYANSWLIPCCDMAALIGRQETGIDWELFLSRAFEYKICIPVEFSLRKTVELFRSPVPSFVLDRLGRYSPNGFERRVFNVVTGPSYKDNVSAKAFLFLLVNSRDSLGPGLLKDLLFPATERITVNYSVTQPLLLPVYYLRRLLNLSSLVFMILRDIICFKRR